MEAATCVVSHDTILFYSKTDEYLFKQQHTEYTDEYKELFNKKDSRGYYMDRNLSASGLSGGGYRYEWKGVAGYWRCPVSTMEQYEKDDLLYYTKNGIARLKQYLHESKGTPVLDLWTDLNVVNSQSDERGDYPTQKPESLLTRIIESSSGEGDLVLDCFVGSGTTCAVAQKLGRRWIGCDINIGAIQTTTKRVNQIVAGQLREKNSFKGSLGLKVLNVNHYDVFKNELEAKEIVMDVYGVEPAKRSYFDGVLDGSFVKVMPLNRVLNKVDVRTVLKAIEDKSDLFTPKKKSGAKEAVFEEGVLVICSGAELDVEDFLVKENKTGVKVELRDIQTDKKGLVFKRKPEASVSAKAKDKKLVVELKDFHSPILMQRLEAENEKVAKKDRQAKVEDFRQIIDSVAIDVDYDGKLFNAEVIDLPERNEVVAARYEHAYPKKGKYTVAVKVVDVLGEEFFGTFKVSA